MNGWLLDRGVLFELREHHPDPRVKSWSDSQRRESLFVSTTTIAAIRHHTERRSDVALQTEVGIWLDEVLRPWFAGRVLPVTESIVLEWRRILSRRSSAGITPSEPDLLLVATARVHRLTICTRDDRAYEGLETPVFNPGRR